MLLRVRHARLVLQYCTVILRQDEQLSSEHESDRGIILKLALYIYCFIECQSYDQYAPTHILPMIRHPAIDACTTGMVSESSPSNTLQEKYRMHAYCIIYVIYIA